MSIDDIIITPQKEVCEHLKIELSNLRFQISEKYDLVEILGTLRTVPDERRENCSIRMMADCFTEDGKLIEVLHSMWIYSLQFSPYFSFKITTLSSAIKCKKVSCIQIYPMYFDSEEHEKIYD